MNPTILNTLSGSVARPASASSDAMEATSNESAPGGFAIALEQAASEHEGAALAADDAPIAAPAAEPVPVAMPTPQAAPLAAEVATATASAARATPPGWPPPGLSSLFPAQSDTAATALAAAGPAPAVATSTHTPMDAATLTATGHSVPRARFALTVGAEALPDDPLGPRLPDAPASSTAAPAAASATPATTTLSASAASNDAIALALARQPAPLRVPVADGESTELGAITSLAETFAPERLPDGALPLSTSTSNLPKLDLAQAFPAPVPLPSKHFADDVGARLQWIAGQQGGEATLRISPEGLGPVEVRMTLDGDRVELGFSATQSETRQALQDALPKLREMLAQQGLQLGHADVGQKHAQSANDDAHHAANGERGADESESGAITLAPAAREASLVIGRSGRGVLDLYA